MQNDIWMVVIFDRKNFIFVASQFRMKAIKTDGGIRKLIAKAHNITDHSNQSKIISIDNFALSSIHKYNLQLVSLFVEMLLIVSYIFCP